MSQLYNNARVLCSSSGLDWAASDMRVALIDTGAYTFDATHVYLDDIPAAAFVGPSLGARAGTALSALAVAATGACDADDVTIPSVSVSGPTIEAFVIFKWVTSSADSLLYAFIDSGSGLPLTPNGGDVKIIFDSGDNRIFRP